MKASLFCSTDNNNSNYDCAVDFPGSLEGKVSTCTAGDPGLIPGSGRSPGEYPIGKRSIVLLIAIPMSSPLPLFQFPSAEHKRT